MTLETLTTVELWTWGALKLCAAIALYCLAYRIGWRARDRAGRCVRWIRL